MGECLLTAYMRPTTVMVVLQAPYFSKIEPLSLSSLSDHFTWVYMITNPDWSHICLYYRSVRNPFTFPYADYTNLNRQRKGVEKIQGRISAAGKFHIIIIIIIILKKKREKKKSWLLDVIWEPTNACKCTWVYYTHRIPPTCFSPSHGHLQGSALQRIEIQWNIKVFVLMHRYKFLNYTWFRIRSKNNMQTKKYL